MTRLIDTQDAFNVLTDYYHHSTHVQHLALQEALNKVPTVAAEPQWIPCSERMPKDEDYHMLYGYYEGVVYWCTDKGVVGFGWYYESTKQWADQNDEWHDRYGEVIAWMPLPKPYEVEE